MSVKKLQKQNCHDLSGIFNGSLPRVVICTVGYQPDQVELMSREDDQVELMFKNEVGETSKKIGVSRRGVGRFHSISGEDG